MSRTFHGRRPTAERHSNMVEWMRQEMQHRVAQRKRGEADARAGRPPAVTEWSYIEGYERARTEMTEARCREEVERLRRARCSGYDIMRDALRDVGAGGCLEVADARLTGDPSGRVCFERDIPRASWCKPCLALDALCRVYRIQHEASLHPAPRDEEDTDDEVES